MSNVFASLAYEMPSVRHFLGRIVEDLSERRSVVVLVPLGIDPVTLADRLRTPLWQRDFYLADLRVTDFADAPSPLVGLQQAFQIEVLPSAGALSVDSVARSSKLPDIVFLNDLQALPARQQQSWLRLIQEWAQASHNLADAGQLPTAFCLSTQASAVLASVPESAIHLGVHWWWGLPSALEMRQLSRLAGGQSWSAASRWREHVLSGLVGSDLGLADFLWDRSVESADGLEDKLRQFAEASGWNPTSLVLKNEGKSLGRPAYSPNYPPPDLRPLWASGAVVYTLEYGVEYSAAALVLLNRKDELAHRLWRGQAEFLLPTIDEVRLRVCRLLTQRYGADWPVRWHLPDSEEERAAVRENPLACQWGYLEWLLRNCDSFRSDKAILPLATAGRQLRNELAHYRPVEFQEVEEFLQLSGRC